MASKKKYVAVDNENIVQETMNFDSGNLKVETEHNTYKDINKVFIKGIRINGGEEVFRVGDDGIVDLQISGSVEPEPIGEKVYLTYYGSSEIKSPEQISSITGTQIAEFFSLDELPGDFSVVDARQILAFAVDNPSKTLSAKTQYGLPYGINKVSVGGSPITKTIGGKIYSVWQIEEDRRFTDKVNFFWS
jgi:hypothetical protein